MIFSNFPQPQTFVNLSTLDISYDKPSQSKMFLALYFNLPEGINLMILT